MKSFQSCGLALFLTGSLLLVAGCASVGNNNVSRSVNALLITGGCCHDYETQARVLTAGISSNAWNNSKLKVNWTVVNQGGKSTNAKIPLHENPNWAQGYDIVVHNECYADVADPEWIRRVTKPHFEGIPAVVIHCAMHTYRAAKIEDWHDFLGVATYHHEASRKFVIETKAPHHPIMKGFPEKWETPVIDELYVLKKTTPNFVALAEAYGVESKSKQPCIWINQYGKARVFGLTTGHRTETLADPDYLALISRGFVWAAGKL
jgi:uncharacterized protein